MQNHPTPCDSVQFRVCEVNLYKKGVVREDGSVWGEIKFCCAIQSDQSRTTYGFCDLVCRLNQRVYLMFL